MEDFKINIDEFTDYKNKSIAEFKAAIFTIENQIEANIKKGHLIEAYKLEKLKIKLEVLLSKKTAHGNKYGYESHNQRKNMKH